MAVGGAWKVTVGDTADRDSLVTTGDPEHTIVLNHILTYYPLAERKLEHLMTYVIEVL